MFNLSYQANIMLILMLINMVVSIIMSFATMGVWGLLYMFLYLFIGGPFIALCVYGIDCLTSGGCNILSWVVTVFYGISMIMMLIWTIILSIIASSAKSVIDSAIE